MYLAALMISNVVIAYRISQQMNSLIDSWIIWQRYLRNDLNVGRALVKRNRIILFMKGLEMALLHTPQVVIRYVRMFPTTIGRTVEVW
jgi:hypothetical protein